MARADLLVKLVKAAKSADKTLFNKVVESVIADERKKQHHILAKQLEEALQTYVSSPKSLNGLPDEKLDSFLLCIHPKKSLDDMVLKPDTVRIIQEFVHEHKRSELLRSYNLEPRNRVLLVGEPGNGKTTLAEAMAEALSVPFYIIRYDGIVGSYLGETAARLKKMFDFIKTQHCVLFFDEFDAIGKERGDIHETGEIKRVVSSLLLQIDNLPSYVISIAATNHPELLDRAVWRRFQIRLELDKPDSKMIEEWLKKFEKRIGEKLGHSFKTLTTKLNGLSFAEIEDFCLDIQRKYVLSQPEGNLKRIVGECLTDLSEKYNLNNGK